MNELLKEKRCQYFSDCGGCSYLDLSEDEYQKNKSQKLMLDLKGLAGAENIKFFWLDIAKRRKIVLHVGALNKIGFFKKNSKEIVEIDKCYIAEDEISEVICEIRKLLSKLEEGLITKIQVTLFDNILDLMFFAKRDLNKGQIKKISEFCVDKKVNISCKVGGRVSPIVSVEPGKLLLKNYTNSDICLDLRCEIFIQASKKGLKRIIEIMNDFVKNNFKKRINIADIYSGFGVYSFVLSDLAHEIHAFEGSQEMVDLTLENAQNNSVKNVVKAQNRDLFKFAVSWQELRNFDLVIINPPRNGATPQVKEIAKSELKNLIYVSCNPKSFAVDCEILLKSGFKLQEIYAIDQFYSTDHFELVALFVRG